MALCSIFSPRLSHQGYPYGSLHINESASRFNYEVQCLCNGKDTYLRAVKTVSQFQSEQSVSSGRKKKIANLYAERRQTIPFPIHVNSTTGQLKPLAEFLRHQAGMESMLNINSLQSYEQIGGNTFRCTLPKMEIFDFEVAPIVDLCVSTNQQECVVEMLSCKFQGSDIVENQNERFSASMRNHLTWDINSGINNELNVHTQLNVSLEVYTLPFTLLPLSAVEVPGNVIMQAMVDRMVPAFLDQLLDDYYKWAQSDDDKKEMPATQYTFENSTL